MTSWNHKGAMQERIASEKNSLTHKTTRTIFRTRALPEAAIYLQPSCHQPPLSIQDQKKVIHLE